ncbi:MAG TPA: hypothetical protein VJV79_40820 [Polyangiaceae bacterium]|nr:hypothetical protein [Polyangiaceae bacterium]
MRKIDVSESIAGWSSPVRGASAERHPLHVPLPRFTGAEMKKRRLTGPRFAELVETCDRAAADRRVADREMHLAVGDNVRAARDKIELADAGQRHASVEIYAVSESIVYPTQPDQKIIADAMHNTEQLSSLSATKPSARSMQRARRWARRPARRSEAKLWIYDERDEPHMLIDLRRRAFEERD